MAKKFFSTDQKDLTLLVLRLALGIMIIPHGAQKLFGWFGGYGFTGSMNFFTTTMGMPYIIGLLVIIGEFFGGLGLITGFLTRFSAFGVGIILFGGAIMVHLQHGFFMNWSGQQKGEGIEFHILAVAMAIVLIIKGGGIFSLDSQVEDKFFSE